MICLNNSHFCDYYEYYSNMSGHPIYLLIIFQCIMQNDRYSIWLFWIMGFDIIKINLVHTGWPNKNYTSFWYFRFIIRTKIKFWSYWRYISSFSQFLTPLSLIKMFKCFLWIMCVPSTHLMLVPIYQTPFWERFRTYPKMKNMLMLVALSPIILQSVL